MKTTPIVAKITSTGKEPTALYRYTDNEGYTSPACISTHKLCRLTKEEKGILRLPKEEQLAWDRDVWRPARKRWKDGNREDSN